MTWAGSTIEALSGIAGADGFHFLAEPRPLLAWVGPDSPGTTFPPTTLGSLRQTGACIPSKEPSGRLGNVNDPERKIDQCSFLWGGIC